MTAPRLGVSGNCYCSSHWPWLENVQVTSITISFYSEVYLLPRYEVRGINSDEIRQWVLRAENDHVQDYLRWANGRGREVAARAERELLEKRYYFLSDCAESAMSWMNTSLLPSLETAAENSIRYWDDSRKHNYGSISRRP